jgi:peptidylprolyl isomerase domain and WD repeat-containing protein 1
LFTLVEKETYALSLDFSPDGETMAIFSPDRFLRLFSVKSGKLLKTLDETLDFYASCVDLARDHILHMDKDEFEKKLLIEKEMGKMWEQGILQQELIPNFSFDETSQFIIVPCMLGIKIVKVSSGEC